MASVCVLATDSSSYDSNRRDNRGDFSRCPERRTSVTRWLRSFPLASPRNRRYDVERVGGRVGPATATGL